MVVLVWQQLITFNVFVRTECTMYDGHFHYSNFDDMIFFT